MTDVSPPALVLRTPDQIVAAVPYLLDFRPSRSLVVIAVKDGGVQVAIRVDLDGATPDRILDAVFAPLARVQPQTVLLVAFTDQDENVTGLVREVARRLTDTGIQVPQSQVVTGQVAPHVPAASEHAASPMRLACRTTA